MQQGQPRYAMHPVRMGGPGSPMVGVGGGPPPPQSPYMNRPPGMPPGSPMVAGGGGGMKRPMVMQSPGGGGGPPGVMKPGGMGGGPQMGPPNTMAPGAPNVPMHGPIPKKKKKVSDKVLPQKVRDLVPESQAYMDLLTFERKLDFTIMRRRLEITEALKKPIKVKRKLRIFISNTFFPSKPEGMDGGGGGPGDTEPTVPSWELRVEGRLLDEKPAEATPSTNSSSSSSSSSKSTIKRKFSSFFKSLVIELDKDLYGPDNHLVEWHRTVQTAETDGFQVKRPGNKNVRCTILLLLDYQPQQYKLDPRLGRLLGMTMATRSGVISAFWTYVKTNRLQDTHEREFINCDKFLEQIFGVSRMKFAELTSRLTPFLLTPDPIVINHLISVEGPPENIKKTTCYDIDVEIEDGIRPALNGFLVNSSVQHEIQSLDMKLHETVDTINQLKTNREFFLGFSSDPQQFIHKWLVSQVRDLKVMTDQNGNSEEERMSDFFFQPWTQEAVSRYFYSKIQQRRAELEQALGIRNT